MSNSPTEDDARRAGVRSSGSRLAATAGLALLLVATGSGAQVVVDGRLQGGPDQLLPGPDVLVPAEAGRLEGANLFHAFRTFGVEAGGSTTFQGPLAGDPVARVVALVTGCASGCDAATRIDGPLALAPEIFTADLYLIDPNGVVFGEGARLDVGGAFTVGSAQAIELADGGLFLAMDPGPGTSTLTTAPIEAFGFLEAPAPIRFEGAQVEVPGRLQVLGGPLHFDGARSDSDFGFVATGAARIDLVALAAGGRVELEPSPDGTLPVTATDFASIDLRDGFVLSSSGLSPGADLASPSPPVPLPGAGDITIRGDDLSLASDARVQAFTATYSDGGDIRIDLSGDLHLQGIDTGLFAGSGLLLGQDIVGSTRVLNVVPVADGDFSFIQVERRFDGAPLDIASNCVSGACRIAYGGFGAFDGDPGTTRALGAAGDVRVDAANVTIEGGAQVSSTSFFGGAAGNIRIDALGEVVLRGAPDLLAGSFDAIRGGLFSNAQAGGAAGRIDVVADTLRLDDFGTIVTELRGGPGTGGDIDVRVDALRISGNGRIDTSTRSEGDAGAIAVRATTRVEIAGSQDGNEFSGITSLAQPESSGAAGRIRVEAPVIALEEGARISTTAFGGGDAGTVDLRFSESMLVSGSTISAEATGAFGGDVYLNGGPVSVDPSGSLAIDAPPGVVTTGNTLRLVDATIDTSVGAGLGSGGNVAIQAGEIVLVRSRIAANADVSNGGNIRLVAEAFGRDDASVIEASSNAGDPGRIEVDALGNVLIPPAVELSTEFSNAASLLRAPCALREAGAGASLVQSESASPSIGFEDYVPVLTSVLGRDEVAAPEASEALAALVAPVLGDGPPKTGLASAACRRARSRVMPMEPQATRDARRPARLTKNAEPIRSESGSEGSGTAQASPSPSPSKSSWAGL